MHKRYENSILLKLSTSIALIVQVLLFSFQLPASSFAQTSISGLFHNYTGLQTGRDFELVAARNRFRLQLDKSVSFGSIYSETDLLDRYANNRDTELLLRELYADWYTGMFDIRIGKQKIIWGTSNGAFVNDIITPVDFRDFITPDVADMRIGVTAINLTRYFGDHSLQAVVAPVKQPNQIPDQDSRWFPVPESSGGLPIRFQALQDQPTLADIQLASRFAWRPSYALDIDLMLYHWAYPVPAYSIEPSLSDFPDIVEMSLTETYHTSPMAGYSLSWQISDSWIITSETVFIHERLFTFLPVSTDMLEEALEDPEIAMQVLQEFEVRDDGYLLKKPWYHQMAGIQTDIQNTTVGLQGFLETILDYESRILSQRLFSYLTGFAQISFLRDRFQTRLTGRYHIHGEDFWTQLQGTYEIADGFELTTGVNLFGGSSVTTFYGHPSFYQFREDSFFFTQLAFYF